MQSNNTKQQVHHKAKIFEKTPQKHKILIKAVIPQKSQLMVTKFNQQDTLAANGYSDGVLRVFNLSTENKISQIDTNSKPKQHIPINCLKWRPQNTNNSTSPVILAANTNGNLYQYVAKTGKQIFHTVQQDNYILAMDYSPDALNFATAGKDNLIRIYDEQTKKITHQLKGTTWQKSGHNNRLFCVRYKKDQPDILCSGGWDMNVNYIILQNGKIQVNVWDKRIGQVISTLYGPKITGQGIDIKGNHIVTAANRGTDQLQLWDWRLCKTVHNYKWDQQQQDNHTFLFTAQFIKNSPSPSMIVACGGVQMKIFSAEQDYKELVQIRFDQGQSIYTCDSSHTTNKYLVGGKTGVMTYLGSNKMLE